MSGGVKYRTGSSLYNRDTVLSEIEIRRANLKFQRTLANNNTGLTFFRFSVRVPSGTRHEEITSAICQKTIALKKLLLGLAEENNVQIVFRDVVKTEKKSIVLILPFKLFFPVTETKRGLGTHKNISPAELMAWDIQYPAFRQILNTGAYLYHEGKLCLCDKDSCRYENGEFIINQIYIDEHEDEYCVSISIISDSAAPVFKKAGKQTTNTSEEAHAVFNEIILSSEDHRRKPTTGGGKGGDNPPSDFVALFKKMRDEKDLTQEELSALASVGIRTIQRMEDSTWPERFQLQQIMRCLIAMKPDPMDCDELINLGGYRWRRNNTLDDTYRRILRYHNRYHNLEEINDYLIKLNFSALSSDANKKALEDKKSKKNPI